MKILKVLSIPLFFSMMFLMTGCQDDEGTNDDVVKFVIDFQSRFGSEDFNYNQEYLYNGRKIKFTKAQLYLSGFTLKGDPIQPIEGTYLSINPSKGPQEIADILTGHGHGVTFSVGIDSATNHADPTAYVSSENPLSATSPDFEHWAWASGYRFIVLEGMVDTSAAMNGAADVFFEMHIGGDPQLREIDLTSHMDIEANTDFMYTVNVDYAELINGVDLENDYITHTMDNLPLAQTIVGNVTNAFTIQ